MKLDELANCTGHVAINLHKDTWKEIRKVLLKHSNNEKIKGVLDIIG